MILVLTRSQARFRQRLAHAVFFRASPSELAPASSLELPQQPSLEEGVNCSDREFGGCPSTLVVRNERFPAVRTCTADCLICPALICVVIRGGSRNPKTSKTEFAIKIVKDLKL